MTKASLETPSDPLRVLNNKDIHEMIGASPTLLPKLAKKLVRRFIKATHVSHDERNKISGHYTVAFGCLQRILAAFFVDSELFQRKHFLLDLPGRVRSALWTRALRWLDACVTLSIRVREAGWKLDACITLAGRVPSAGWMRT